MQELFWLAAIFSYKMTVFGGFGIWLPTGSTLVCLATSYEWAAEKFGTILSTNNFGSFKSNKGSLGKQRFPWRHKKTSKGNFVGWTLKTSTFFPVKLEFYFSQLHCINMCRWCLWPHLITVQFVLKVGSNSWLSRGDEQIPPPSYEGKWYRLKHLGSFHFFKQPVTPQDDDFASLLTN